MAAFGRFETIAQKLNERQLSEKADQHRQCEESVRTGLSMNQPFSEFKYASSFAPRRG